MSIDFSAQCIEEIPVSAFAGCTNISKVIFSHETKILSSDCFAGCYYLEVSLPATLTSIDNVGLALNGVSIPIGLLYIGPSAFMAATFSDRNAELLSLTSVGESAFSYSDI